MPTRTALVTGSSSGIGRATVEAFLDEEWAVYATARQPADVEGLGERERCTIATLDVTDPNDADRVVARMIDEEGRIDCLVNNAGFGRHGPIEDVPVAAVRKQFEVNTFGPHRLARAVLPHMRDRGDGTIVNVSSFLGRVSLPGTGVYAGSKFALEAMSDALRAEVDGFGIDVVLVEPGPVQTSFRDRAEAELSGDGETAEDGRTDAYEALYRSLDDVPLIGTDGPISVPPDRVAADIVDAASSTKPPARYPVGPVGRALVLGRFVPDRLRDLAFSVAEGR